MLDVKRFVECIEREVVEKAVRHYASTMKLEPPASEMRYPQWEAILPAVERMGPEEKQAVYAVVKLAIVETVSHMFGILDGSSILDEFRDNFELTYGPRRATLSGDLQDVFLSDKT